MRPFSLTFTVPDGMWLTSNGRYHWADRARRTRRLRTLGHWEGKRSRVPTLGRARITAHITFRTGGRADPANAYPTIKALIDGLVDAGLLPDDDASRLEGPDMRREPGKPPPRTRVVRLYVKPLAGETDG